MDGVNPTEARRKAQQRQMLRIKVKAYLKRGGTITVLPAEVAVKDWLDDNRFQPYQTQSYQEQMRWHWEQ